jgi:hypothetical protein
MRMLHDAYDQDERRLREARVRTAQEAAESTILTNPGSMNPAQDHARLIRPTCDVELANYVFRSPDRVMTTSDELEECLGTTNTAFIDFDAKLREYFQEYLPDVSIPGYRSIKVSFSCYSILPHSELMFG